MTSELNRVGSDVSCSSMDDDRLASFEPGLVEQTLPGRNTDDGNGSRFDIAERAWLLREHPGRRHSVLGVSANELRVGHAENLVSDRQPGNPGTQSRDFAGQIRAQRERKRLWQCTLARPDPSVPGADACCVNSNKDFAWTKVWPRSRFENHRFRRAELMHAPGHHRGRAGLCAVLPMRVLVILASLLPSIVRFGYSPEFQSRMSPFGTNRTNRAGLAMSVDPGKPEVALRGRQDRFLTLIGSGPSGRPVTQ